MENGDLKNDGTWNAPIEQYCVSGSAIGLGASLPISEDCSGMADFFNPCTCLVQPAIIVVEEEPVTNTVDIALSGTLDPALLTVEGGDAIVDWMLLELRDPNNEEIIVEYATVALQADGDIVSEDGEALINFPNLVEGDYLVTLRHRNHLPLMTDVPMTLSVLDPMLVDFTDPTLAVRGGETGGRIQSGGRAQWGGDYNGDGRIIYQGPNNDVFFLFSRVLGDLDNSGFLANYIVVEYDVNDFNLDGKVIYQGPNNDRASLLYHSVLAHAGNANFLANFIVQGFLP